MDHISPIGHSWEELQKMFLTPEEIAASRLRVAKMIKISRARREREEAKRMKREAAKQKKLAKRGGAERAAVA